MQDLLALFIGVGLAAACGFRVFVPLLGISLAAASGHLELAEGFGWLADPVTVAALVIGTVLEMAAYYTPWLDNLLDSAAAPAAVIAGIIATASVTGEMSPLLQWSLAVIAGGGAAAIVQGGTTLLRASSTMATGGLANPLVATGELAGAATMTLAAVLLPTLAFVVVVALCAAIAVKLVQAWNRRRYTPVATTPLPAPGARALPRS